MLRQALAGFLEHAYASGKIPESRRKYAAVVDAGSLDEFLAQVGAETLEPSTPSAPGGFALRVGCEWYSHLKLTVRPFDWDVGFVFGVDTHDALRVPPNSPEEPAIRALQQRNRELAERIERTWTEHGLPTQAAALRAFLHRSGADDSTVAGCSKGLLA
jgi:hypothetical protein